MKLGIMRLTLELLTPLRIGSGANDPLLDAPVVRDAFGDYRIPGSSLAGALRSLAEVAGLGPCFGEGRESNRASNVEISDGFLVDWDGRTTLAKRLRGEVPQMPRIVEVQDHVRIDHASGTAAVGGKYDAEIVPQGSRFRFEFACVDRGEATTAVDPARVLGFVLASLQAGAVRLGGDVTGGLGMVRPVADSVTHDFLDLGTVPGLVAARAMPRAIDVPLGQRGGPSSAGPVAPRPDQGSLSGEIRLRFLVDGPILVGGSQRPRPPGRDETIADMSFGHTLVADYGRGEHVSRPWIPGSSLRGVIRHRVLHVLEAGDRADRAAAVDDWFGSVGDSGAKMSRVRVHGQVLDDIPPTVVQHVAIDRLTSGSLRGALFTEAPIWKNGLEVAVTIEVDRLPLDGAAALAHALIDLGSGDLPIGGGVNRGNGRLSFADESEPANALHGKAVRFDLYHGSDRYSHTDPPDRLRAFVALLDASKPSGAAVGTAPIA